MLTPLALFKCLADDTRLNTVLLIKNSGELCVCDMVKALKLSQPKISRHLAQLKLQGIVEDRRDGQWVYYKLKRDLPAWSQNIIKQANSVSSITVTDKSHCNP